MTTATTRTDGIEGGPAAGLVGGAIVPGAPLLLPTASPGQPAAIVEQVAALRSDVRDALHALPDADAIVLVGAGRAGLFRDAEASLAPLGVRGASASAPVAADLLADVARVTRYPVLPQTPLGPDLSVLVLLLHEICEIPVVPVTVPADAAADGLVHVGAGLAEAARGTTAALVGTGDLAATLTTASPGYLVEDAERWDQRLLAAFRDRGLDALARLGPADAARVRARSWAPLVVAAAAARAEGLAAARVRYHAPRGVGQLVAELRAGAPGA